MQAISETELPKGKTLRDAISDQAGRKLVDWFLYRGGYGTAGEIRAFMVANPAWPDRERLTQRAEEALFKSTRQPARGQGVLRRHGADDRRRAGDAGRGAGRRQ